MSGKLDQSLDQIMADGKTERGPRGRGKPRPARRAAATKARAAIAAPTGGIQKQTRAAKTGPAVITAPVSGESKIIVSNLPEDVNETQIKDYFGKTIGHVKKVFLTYGPSGRSRGVATIVFSKPGSGAAAAKQLDGVKVDNKAMKVEVVLGAKQAPVIAAPLGLGDRISKPKSAAEKKARPAGKAANGAAVKNGAVKAGRDKKSGRAGRPKKKTAEELDAEMTDYFGDGSATNAPNGTAQATAPAAAGEAGVVDEVM